MTKKELVKFLIDNFTTGYGDLDLKDLDFSKFEGDIFIGGMIVPKNLCQCGSDIGGNWCQSNLYVHGDLNRTYQIVGGKKITDE